MQHPSIVQASVVGIADAKYGETVGSFIQLRKAHERPSAEKLREFVRQTLGWHKAPLHVFWLQPDEDFPKTGSGKIKKHILKEMGAKMIKKDMRLAKL